jgi:DNA polymerase-3 subunit delta'
LKVALILEAEWMCIQQAESANAFLKTLAEPPDHSLLLPTSDRLEALLPTIRSRCLTFPVIPGIDDLIRDGSSPPSRMPWVRIAALRFCSPFF